MTVGSVYRVQYDIVVSGDRKSFAMSFECEHASVAELAAALRCDGIVAGHRLELVSDGRGGSMIRKRSGCALGLAGLVTIQDYVGSVWEPEE
mgnify:CR=1 FL=1